MDFLEDSSTRRDLEKLLRAMFKPKLPYQRMQQGYI